MGVGGGGRVGLGVGLLVGEAVRVGQGVFVGGGVRVGLGDVVGVRVGLGDAVGVGVGVSVGRGPANFLSGRVGTRTTSTRPVTNWAIKRFGVGVALGRGLRVGDCMSG